MTRRFAAILLFSFFLCTGIGDLAVAQSPGPVSEREWRLADGSVFRGTIQPQGEKDSESVQIVSREQNFEVKISDLSPTDRAYVRNFFDSLLSEADIDVLPEEPVEMTVVMNDDFNKPGVAPGDHRSMVVNGVEYRFCWCPPGTFMMGSAEDEKDHENFETLHEVTLTRGFWLLETEVTQLLWRSVTGRTVKDELRLYQPNVGGVFEPDEIKRVDRLGYGSSYPIYFISWNEATDFCRILSEKTGLNIQLPTEAQWEYACRAGTLGPFAVTQVSEVTLNAEGVTTTRLSMTDPADMCWYNENSNAGVQEVKQRVPNAWGLYDMHGNVWEMCADRYSKDYYSRSPATDPTGSTSGEYRVNRGGSWFSYLKFCRSACRYRNAEDYRYNNLGFRIAINPR